MKIKLGKNSYDEILKQNDSWEAILKDKKKYIEKLEAFKNDDIKNAIFIGCGSSYYISLSGSFIFSKLTGINSKAVPASEIIFYPEVYLPAEAKTIVFAVSRSGKTTEVIKAIEKISNYNNIITVAFTCYENSELAKLCDYSFITKKGKEKSVVMTKSFTSLLFAIQQFSGIWGNKKSYLKKLDKLPELFNLYIEKWQNRIQEYVSDNSFEFYEFLGHGNYYGVANEAMLKMKEMAIVSSEDFHSLEFRHGPKSIVNKKMLITIYTGETTYTKEVNLIEELLEYGANLFIIGNNISAKIKNAPRTFVIDLNTEFSQFVLTPLIIVPSQLYAYFVATSKGLDVDNPQNLTQVVEKI